MIELSDEAMDALTRSHKRYMRVDSYYDGKLLKTSIPFMSAIEEEDSYAPVQQRVEFRIPRIVNGYNWTPTDTYHPLAANGQILRVVLGVGQGENEPDWFQRGKFRIINTTTEGDDIVVEAVSLTWAITIADFNAPYQPSGTFASTVRDLISSDQGQEVPLHIDDALDDRNIPAALDFGTSRIGALIDTLKAWPAEMAMHHHGYLWIRPLLENRTPVLNLVHGYRGTIIGSSGTSTSDNAWNCIVVRGKTPDGQAVQAVAYNLDANHPRQYGGPFSRLPIPLTFENDAITSTTQARRSAQAILAREKKHTAIAYDIEMIPHPALQIGDVLRITTDQGRNELVEITELKLPYLHSDGTQSLVVRRI
jgi:hypothetical protein